MRRHCRRAGDPRRLLPHSLALARAHALRTIAFPAISTGVYGYPVAEAAAVAAQAVAGELADFDEILFVCFGADALAHYSAAIERHRPR